MNLPRSIPVRRGRQAQPAPEAPALGAGALEHTSDAGSVRSVAAAGGTSGAVGSSGGEQLLCDRLPLRTPAEAAKLLAVRESWLRRKAAARAIPCSYLGKHLRFSPADLAAITATAAQPARTRAGSPRSRPGGRSRHG